jgi:hypothetical protein
MEQEIKVRRVDFYPTEWLEGTISLSHLERSVYITICAAIFAHGGAVETSHVHKLCAGKGFQKGLAGLVAKGKVIQEGTLLGQLRALKEVGLATVRVHEARKNGAKGGRPKKGLAKPNGYFSAKPNHQPPTIIENPSSSNGAVSARACVQREAAAHAHDAEPEKWKPLGIVLGHPTAGPPPPSDENLHALRQQQHLAFLKTRGAAGELDLYLAAQMSDDPDAAQRMFEMTEARMCAEP